MKSFISKLKKFFLFFIFYFLFWPSLAKAICPVCTVGVAAGLGLSRWFGVDDTISGIWIGALLASMSGWTINWLKKRKINFFGMPALITIIYYAAALIPLLWKEIIGHPFNKLWGIDKLVLGVAFGSIIFILSYLIYSVMKKNNGNHAHFPFEKIVIPISSLIILSAVFYFITR